MSGSSDLFYWISVTCVVFFSTNIDNFICLIGFFSKKSSKTKHVILGWFTGSFLIIAFSLIAAFIGATIIPKKWINLLGIFPIVVGIKSLYDLKNSSWKISPILINSSRSQILTGATVTLANGIDNISAYIPLFILASESKKILLTISIFTFWTTVFCIMGYILVRKNSYISRPIKRYGPIILPFILIFMGCSILIRGFYL